MAVQPDLGGIGNVAADLDEAGSKLFVEDVEVVGAHASLGLVEGEVDGSRFGCAVGASEDPLDLLGNDDGHHSRFAGALEVGADMVQLAVVPATAVGLLQTKDRDGVTLGEGPHCLAEAVAHALEEGRRRDRVAEVSAEEADNLAADLQVGDVGVEVDAVEAVQIEHDMAIEHVVDVREVGHRCGLANRVLKGGMAMIARVSSRGR